MRSLFRFLLWLMALAILVYGGMNLTSYLHQSSLSSNLNESLIHRAVLAVGQRQQESVQTETGPQPGEASPETAPISVDFTVLREINPDVVGWLYCEDTPINLPLVRGKNNDVYLHRMIDGSWNPAGTLFLDYRNAGDFSHGNTIIYGHNMKDKSMFAVLPSYNDPEFYAQHPVMWLLTPEQDYKVELVAGCLTSSDSAVYSFGQSQETVYQQVLSCMDRSTFQSGLQISQEDRFVTLSTCSYEFEEARYILLGRLISLA